MCDVEIGPFFVLLQKINWQELTSRPPIIGIDKYDELTSIDSYAAPTKPAAYDPAITNATPTHKRKQREEEWNLIRTLWFIHKGFLRGIVDNLCNALEKHYYAQLKHRLTAYRNVPPFQLLEDLKDC